MITALDSAAASSALATSQDLPGCAWWNLACKGGEQAANSGLSAITKSIASGAEMLLGEIVKVIDDSSAVPLADPTYQHVYYGFLGLAAPLVGIVLSIALVAASLRRDASTLGRAFIGVGVACVGGALYIVFAQLLIGIDDWLSHGVVEVTGYNLSQSITQIAAGFHNIAGTQGEMAANMLLLLLMLVMLVAGMILWFVLVLRKIAILVVVAFAPLLIAGYLWAPTRSWVRKTTEVLIALVFTKTAIFTLFGIGLALLSRGTGQSLSDFVGATVLMCGACFAPLVMLRLVHFAADSHLAGDAIGTLSGGMRPVTSRLTGHSPTPMSRHDLARQQSSTPRPDGPTPVKAAPLPSPGTATPPAASGSGASAAGAAATGGAGLAAGAAIGVASSAKAAAQSAEQSGAQAATRLSPPTDRADQPLRGPDLPGRDQTDGKDT
jgi:type IV secretion system protein TrbL